MKSKYVLYIFILLCTPPLMAAAIRIKNISDLDFGLAGQGASVKTVLASTSENSTNGSFQVTGDANRAYSIVLPTTATMSTTGNGIKTMTISAFTSFPTSATGGQLNGAGSQMVYVGATRNALSASQAIGSYSGTYSITVVY